MKMLVVLPARLNSKRIPHKPLQVILGKPLLQRVVEEVLAMNLGAQHIVVAADSEELCGVVEGWESCDVVDVELVDVPCRNGTERVAWLFEHRPQYRDVDVVVNIQVDQLLLPREAVLGAVDRVVGKTCNPIGTVVVPQALCHDPYPMPYAVEALVERDSGRCLSFWRGPLWRQKLVLAPHIWVGRHVGVYAYHPLALEEWARLPFTREERETGLEQLRPLIAGCPIGAALLLLPLPLTIDTPQDLQWARQQFS